MYKAGSLKKGGKPEGKRQEKDMVTASLHLSTGLDLDNTLTFNIRC